MNDVAIERLQMDFLDHLRITKGNVTEACKNMQVSFSRYLQWLNDDPGFRFQVMVVKEAIGDFVEDKLLQRINDGDTTAIIFYCKTKLKHRGYVEDSKGMPQSNKTRINVSINMPDKKPQFQEVDVIEPNT
jgi:hypothetical protein